MSLCVEEDPAGLALQREACDSADKGPPASLAGEQGEGAEEDAAGVVHSNVGIAQPFGLRGEKLT